MAPILLSHTSGGAVNPTTVDASVDGLTLSSPVPLLGRLGVRG